MIAEEANISPSRVLTSLESRVIDGCYGPAAPAEEQTDTAGKTALERQKSKDLHTAVEISEGSEIRLGRANCSMAGETRGRSVSGAPGVLRVIGHPGEEPRSGIPGASADPN
jgi:hypothetical protein